MRMLYVIAILAGGSWISAAEASIAETGLSNRLGFGLPLLTEIDKNIIDVRKGRHRHVMKHHGGRKHFGHKRHGWKHHGWKHKRHHYGKHRYHYNYPNYYYYRYNDPYYYYGNGYYYNYGFPFGFIIHEVFD